MSKAYNMCKRTVPISQENRFRSGDDVKAGFLFRKNDSHRLGHVPLVLLFFVVNLTKNMSLPMTHWHLFR